MSVPDVLVIAATARELAAPDGWRTLACGVGPVEAACATAAAIAERRPELIVHVGIAGARRSASLAAGTLVIGERSVYCDLAVPPAWAPSELLADAAMLAALRETLPEARVEAIGTSARVGGTVGCAVEAMEGFGVLRAATLAGVPAIEVRAISNEIEEPDRARWHFGVAFAAITEATPRLVQAARAAVLQRNSDTP